METVVRFGGIVEEVLNELLHAGYFKTKAEAIRAGVLGLGKEYNILNELRSDLKYAQEIDWEIKSGKIKLGTEKELQEIIRKKKAE